MANVRARAAAPAPRRFLAGGAQDVTGLQPIFVAKRFVRLECDCVDGHVAHVALCGQRGGGRGGHGGRGGRGGRGGCAAAADAAAGSVGGGAAGLAGRAAAAAAAAHDPVGGGGGGGGRGGGGAGRDAAVRSGTVQRQRRGRAVRACSVTQFDVSHNYNK